MLQISVVSTVCYDFCTSWPWARWSSLSWGRWASCALNQQRECVRKRLTWCYPWKRPGRGENTASLARLHPTAGVGVCLTGDALLSLSLFICDLSASARLKGHEGFCYCSPMFASESELLHALLCLSVGLYKHLYVCCVVKKKKKSDHFQYEISRIKEKSLVK